MAQCREIVKLFENAGYIIENTAHSSSHQNGPGERPHQTLADGIRALLTGSGLPIAFWPCVLQHFVQLYNVCGQQPNLRHLWTFGFYKILSTGPRLGKQVNHYRIGYFLGYCQSYKKVLVFDPKTNHVVTSQHVVFDEAMSDVPDRPLNAHLLDTQADSSSPDLSDIERQLPDFEIGETPFNHAETVKISLDWSCDNPLGFGVLQCDTMLCACIADIWGTAKVSGENTTSSAFQQHLHNFETSLEQPQIPSNLPSLPVHCVRVQEMTDKERNMTSFTR